MANLNLDIDGLTHASGIGGSKFSRGWKVDIDDSTTWTFKPIVLGDRNVVLVAFSDVDVDALVSTNSDGAWDIGDHRQSDTDTLTW